MAIQSFRDYVLISPCRNEAPYMRRTLDSVVAQTYRPALWLIVDDGSTDETPQILAEYAAKNPWIHIVTKPDRGHRAVGPGVVEAFYFGLSQIDWQHYTFLCKLDLDLDLSPGYFEGLMARMDVDPRLGSCSGKPWFKDKNGRHISEGIGDEMSAGMTKFYRTSCFRQIGGFVREVMWDAIDCHKSRQLGWTCRSFDGENLRFEHLRPMGSSQKGILTGRMRHGAGQYFMGSDFIYFMATCIWRLRHPPVIVGSAAAFWGFVVAWWQRKARHEDGDLIKMIRKYQRRALLVGKSRAIAEIEAAYAHLWTGGQ